MYSTMIIGRPLPLQIYIATVQMDEAVHVERLPKNMAAPGNSQGSASIKKRGTVAIEAI